MISVTRRTAVPTLLTLLVCMPLASKPRVVQAGIPWISTESEAEKEARYAYHAQDPVGARQKYKYGKAWPPYPRPIGEPQLLVHRFHAAHYWPWPYIDQDRSYIRNLSQLHVCNGWINATTLYDYHFDPATNELNRAGRIQLKWILQNAPQPYRLAFVQTASNAEHSQQRMASVHDHCAELVGAENTPPVMLRVASPLRRAAEEVDAIRRKEIQSIPTPRIGGSGAGASGGGGAAASAP